MERRWLRFIFSDGTTKGIELKKVTSLKVPEKHRKVCLHIDRIDDGYLMVVDEGFWNVEKEKLINIIVERDE